MELQAALAAVLEMAQRLLVALEPLAKAMQAAEIRLATHQQQAAAVPLLSEQMPPRIILVAQAVQALSLTE